MSKRLTVNDILTASDIDYIDTIEEENVKLRSHIKGLGNNISEMSGLIRSAQDRAEKTEVERDELKERHLNLAIYHTLDPQQGCETAKDAIRVRDIEQQIKALESSLTENSRTIPFPYNCNTDVVYSDDIKYDIEQLRKELEK